jgi:antagonist of KipI
MLRVLSPGLLTTVQDLGRPGYGAFGVPPSGALDEEALVRANLLAGNAPGAAALELSFQGPELEALEPTRVALAGGDFGPAPGRVLRLASGDRLDLSRPSGGPRAVLAVEGGLDVPLVLGSRSTCLPGRFGGLQGRRLRRGDILRSLPPPDPARGRRGPVTPSAEPAEPAPPVTILRVLAGPHLALLPPDAAAALHESTLVLSPESNRTGFRLSGEVRLEDRGALRLPSYPTAPGTIQLTGSGQLLVLLADRPTTGGYPWVATLVRADAGRLVRLWPGARVRLCPVPLAEARRLLAEREERMPLAEGA